VSQASANTRASRRVAIIGGGIAGLAAAYELEKARRAGEAVSYSLYEATGRIGGNVRTDVVEGCIVEAGPDSFLTAKPWARELAAELGLAGELISSNDAERRTYMLRGGKLISLPEGLQLFVPSRPVPAFFSPLFSWRTKLAFMREMIAPPLPLAAEADESVASFVERHFGSELVETLAAPLLAGVYGGDAARLSARSVMPRLVEVEAEHRSLVRAAMRSSGRSREQQGASASIFTSMRHGLQQLTDAMAAQLLPGSVQLNAPLSALRAESAGWRAVLANGSNEMFTDVIIATPTYISAALLESAAAKASGLLGSFEHTSSTTVAFGYRTEEIPALPKGFGFLVGRSAAQAQTARLLACTFVDQKFAHRAPQGMKVLRMFVACGDDAGEEELVRTLRAELQRVLGIAAQPRFVRVYRWPRAMLQHHIGHLERVRRLQEEVSQLPGVQLAGGGIFGVGLPDAVKSGRDAAKRVLQERGEQGSRQPL